jgi:hypothetical protein
MPSPSHEILVELFRHRPDLITTLLALVDGRLVPDIPDAALLPAPGEISGVHHAQYRADLVLHCMAPGRERPVHAFVVEIQLAPDQDKDFTWPLYAAGVRARERCPVTLVVITLDERTASWARKRIEFALGRPKAISAAVIGPAQVPRITEVARARALPELAVLSAAAHGDAPDAAQIAHVAFRACAALDSRQSAHYADLITARLSPQAQHDMEVIMEMDQYWDRFPPLSDIGKRFYAKGRKAGRADGARELLIEQLTQRFGPLSEAAMEQLEGAAAGRLKYWGGRLLSATSLDEVFAGTSRPGVRAGRG